MVKKLKRRSNNTKRRKPMTRSAMSARSHHIRTSGARVAIIMGSDSDYSVMEGATLALQQFQIPYEVSVVSAHRTPKEMVEFAEKARGRGIQVIIAGAGGAAHLPGMVASISELPVIGVPVPVGTLQGHDALLSIVQMPKGVPVATVAIGNAFNAGILAAQIIGAGGAEKDIKILDLVDKYKKNLRSEVILKSKRLTERTAIRRKFPVRRERRGS